MSYGKGKFQSSLYKITYRLLSSTKIPQYKGGHIQLVCRRMIRTKDTLPTISTRPLLNLYKHKSPYVRMQGLRHYKEYG